MMFLDCLLSTAAVGKKETHIFFLLGNVIAIFMHKTYYILAQKGSFC